jgi:hypothetical protein
MFHFSSRARHLAAAAVTVAFIAPQAAAAPTLAIPAAGVPDGSLTNVRYYRHHYRGPGPAIAGAALGLFALGAAAAAANSYDDYYYPGYGYPGYYGYYG